MSKVVRVCVISDGCSELIIPADKLNEHITEIQDDPDCVAGEDVEYTLRFTWMDSDAVDELNEFSGF